MFHRIIERLIFARPPAVARHWKRKLVLAITWAWCATARDSRIRELQWTDQYFYIISRDVLSRDWRFRNMRVYRQIENDYGRAASRSTCKHLHLHLGQSFDSWYSALLTMNCHSCSLKFWYIHQRLMWFYFLRNYDLGKVQARLASLVYIIIFNRVLRVISSCQCRTVLRQSRNLWKNAPKVSSHSLSLIRIY